MAYRKHLDDIVTDPIDDHPFEIEGNSGIERLTEDY